MNELYEFTESYLESHETIETDKDNSKSVNSNKVIIKCTFIFALYTFVHLFLIRYFMKTFIRFYLYI